MKNNKGQSIFEVLVAIAVISSVLVALVGYVSTALKNSTFSKNISNGTRFTEEAIEWLRSERDASWVQFKARAQASGTYCLSTSPLSSSSWVSTGACAAAQYIAGTIFRRQVTFTCFVSPPTSTPCSNVAVTTIQAQVNTYFIDGQGTHNSSSTTYLTNWK